MKSELISQTPTWYVLLCACLGIAFAFFYYFRAKAFTRNQKISLAAIRAALGFCVAFLLLNPLIKTISSITLKPKVVVLLDNSRSMLHGSEIEKANHSVTSLKKNIEDKGYEVEIRDIEDNIISSFDKKSFTNKKTNLSAALNSIRNSYEGQNLSDVIVLSDGIINDGVSPTFQKYPFNIHTVGFGDSTLKKDAFIVGISANKLAYLGNNFTISVDIASYLLAGKSTKVIIKDSDGLVLDQSPVSYPTDDTFQTISFQLPAKKVGKQRFVVELQGVNGENTLRNNSREFVVDIVNGKEKILLLAYAPHPDVKALKSIIDKNDLFELTIKIVQSTDPAVILKENYDLLVLHQLPDIDGTHTKFLPQLLSRQKPTFFIVGGKTDLSYLNGMQNIVGINSQRNRTDKVSGQINTAFNMFSLGESQNALISSLPPLTVPFGSYSPQAGAETILGQYVSGVNANKPMLAVNLTGSRKMAVFVADGLWSWRMEEFAQNQNNQYIDDLFTRTLQLISVKEDKGKLRVYPAADVFEVDQKTVFIAEVYNEIFERIYGQDVRLKIKAQKGTEKVYDFKITEANSRFELTNLPAGIYNYEATAKILNKEERSIGQFVISNTDTELQNTVANFALLRTLSQENNGDFVNEKNIIELRNSLEKSGLVNKILANEELKDLINFRWLLLLILLLATAEWVIRKYIGSY